jgi:hypothetical protein
VSRNGAYQASKRKIAEKVEQSNLRIMFAGLFGAAERDEPKQSECLCSQGLETAPAITQPERHGFRRKPAFGDGQCTSVLRVVEQDQVAPQSLLDSQKLRALCQDDRSINPSVGHNLSRYSRDLGTTRNPTLLNVGSLVNIDQSCDGAPELVANANRNL